MKVAWCGGNKSDTQLWLAQEADQEWLLKRAGVPYPGMHSSKSQGLSDHGAVSANIWRISR